MEIVILQKHAKKQISEYAALGYSIIDVTSRSQTSSVKFSPFYPHGDIPIPGMSPLCAESVEGIWQGLKQMEVGGLDYGRCETFFCFTCISSALTCQRRFRNKTMRGLKRSGNVLGHKYGNMLLNYVQARKLIYVPAYEWVLENKLWVEVRTLRFAPSGSGSQSETADRATVRERSEDGVARLHDERRRGKHEGAVVTRRAHQKVHIETH